MEIINVSLEDVLNPRINDLIVEKETKAYILSIFFKYQSANQDLSRQSLTLEFHKAKEKYDFAGFQNIGDWVFWMDTIYPDTFSDYQNTLAKLSYYKCYKILNKQWKLFEELADEFEIIVERLKF